MGQSLIHPTAVISPNAKIGENVKIGAYADIGDDVVIGDMCEVRSHAVLASGARLANNVRICSFAVIGTEPQDLKFKDEVTYAEIGENSVIREFVTINRGTTTGKTVVGANCLIMAYCHVAHDCRVGDEVVMANVAQLAGHVSVESYSTLAAFSKFHQFSKIGPYTMIAANADVSKDVLPYALLGRLPKLEGVNKIGLKRRGFSEETVAEIDTFYRDVFFSGLNTTDGIKKYLDRGSVIPETQRCIDFIHSSKRGIYRP